MQAQIDMGRPPRKMVSAAPELAVDRYTGYLTQRLCIRRLHTIYGLFVVPVALIFECMSQIRMYGELFSVGANFSLDS